jgi:hypothetical protein
MAETSVSFGNNDGIDAAHRLYSSSPKSVLYHCKPDIGDEPPLLRAFSEFAEKNGLYSQRDGSFKFHFLCASLLDSQGSVYPDVNRRYGRLVSPFKSLVSQVRALPQPEEKAHKAGDFEQLWERRRSSLGRAQEIARIKFRLPEYSVILLRHLTGKFGMCCMVHDRYIFVNAQAGEDSFQAGAVFHELLHQLLAGHRCEIEGKFFTGRFLWHPRRMMVEEIVLPCLQMEVQEDSKDRERERETVLHLEESRPFLSPFTPLFSKILRDWEQEYMSSLDMNLQDFVDRMVRRYLKFHRFVLLMGKMKESMSRTSQALGK